MPVAVWKESYRTGDALVDAQHQELFRIVNELHDAMLSGHGHEGLLRTIDGLERHALAHFATEEALMRRVAYPGLDRHRGRHVAMLEQAGTFIAAVRNGQPLQSLALARLLGDWIAHHIADEDMELVQWIRRHEAATGPQTA